SAATAGPPARSASSLSTRTRTRPGRLSAVPPATACSWCSSRFTTGPAWTCSASRPSARIDPAAGGHHAWRPLPSKARSAGWRTGRLRWDFRLPLAATLKAETEPRLFPACALETNSWLRFVGRNSLPKGPVAWAGNGEPGAGVSRPPDPTVNVEPARGVSAPAGLILKPVKFGVRAEFLYYSEP